MPTAYRDQFCPQCGAPMVRRWSLKYKKFFFGCSEWPDCDGTHGCHPDGTPLGIPADRETRDARALAHGAFDKLWYGRGPTTREKAYSWLADRLGIPSGDCHIGRFDKATCERVVTVCEEMTDGPKANFQGVPSAQVRKVWQEGDEREHRRSS